MRRILLTVAVLSFAFSFVSAIAAEEPSKIVTNTTEAAANTAAEAMTAPVVTATPAAPAAAAETSGKIISIYGEIREANKEAGSISIQYYDYDADDEKTTEIFTDSATKLENVNGFGEIQRGDWADVDYSAAAGRNTAKLIRVEKEEEPTDEVGLERTPVNKVTE